MFLKGRPPPPPGQISQSRVGKDTGNPRCKFDWKLNQTALLTADGDNARFMPTVVSLICGFKSSGDINVVFKPVEGKRGYIVTVDECNIPTKKVCL